MSEGEGEEKPISKQEMAKEPGKEYWIKSASVPGKHYSVFNSIHKGWRCECMHFTFRQTDCRHIKQAKHLEKHPNRQIKNG